MTLPDAAYVAALAALPDVGPARLRGLLAAGPPPEVLARLVRDELELTPELAAACARADASCLVASWCAAARSLDVARLWEAHAAAGIAVVTPDDDEWPPMLHADPDPPAVLFARGSLDVLAEGRPRVAVVGTRACTRYGWDVAHRFGADLAAAGVSVVSGLARGIDAAAHRGVLDAFDELGSAAAPPVGVVGTGLDVVYPSPVRDLWEHVATTGVLISEAPLGTRPTRWRFPARNRIIAAVADAVVVVESPASGGALHTVDEALERDREVLAVPGPVTSPASRGTNRLLADSAVVATDAGDVLAALGIAGRSPNRHRTGPAHPDDPVHAAVLDAVGWTPTTLDAIAAGAGQPLGAAAGAIAALEAGGHVVAAGPATWMRAHCDNGVTKP